MKDIITRSLKAAFGLVLFAFGTYLTVQADIGIAPWDVLSKGIANHSALTYGQAAIAISVIIIIFDLILKEKIGIGTILDAFIVGMSLDFFEGLHLIARSKKMLLSLIMITIGMFIMAYSQYFYMSAGLCCGPRDSFLVGIGKRFKKVPIGMVNIVIMSVVFVVGTLLGGPIGIGTLYSVAGIGAIQQLIFNLLKFEPRKITHISLTEIVNKKQLTAKFQ